MKITLRLYQARQTNVYELHCQTINRKCALDRNVNVKTVVLMVLLDRTSVYIMHNVPDFLAAQIFRTVFKINC